MNDEGEYMLRQQVQRLQFAVMKLSGSCGFDIADLVEAEWLEEGDMD